MRTSIFVKLFHTAVMLMCLATVCAIVFLVATTKPGDVARGIGGLAGQAVAAFNQAMLQEGGQ